MTEALRTLTPRQKQIARLMRDGKRAAQVAEELGMNIRTVEGYIDRIYRVLRVSGHVELVGALLLPMNSPLRRTK